MPTCVFKYFILSLVFSLASISQADDSFPYVDFDVSMAKESKEFKEKYKGKVVIEKLKELYEKNSAKHVIPCSTPRIPKIIHQIWVGGKPLPAFYKKLSESWKKMHPDWHYILWTDEDVKKMKLDNQDLYNKAKLGSEKANILRYQILREYGGVYVDMDFECVKPLDILNHCYDFFVGILPNNCFAILANGLFGTIPHHPIIEALNSEMKNYVHNTSQVGRNGVVYFSSMFFKLAFQDQDYINIALPKTYFYPIKKLHGTPLTSQDYVRPESFGIHYWGTTLEQKIALYKLYNKINKLPEEI